MRRLRRNRSYELVLNVSDDAFLPFPRERQRTWLVNRVLKEAGEELEHLDRIAPEFVPGSDATIRVADLRQASLCDDDIMEDWQTPVMARMAELATVSHGDILEIGFGRGIASDFIQQHGVRSHTIIECNDGVVDRFQAWRQAQGDADIRLVHGMWQDELPKLERYDGIFFHTYPLNDSDFVEQVAKSSTFAEHFFPHAARHLRPEGTFVYLTMEMDSIGRGHQRALLNLFSSVSISLLDGLEIPADTHDSHWVSRMLMVEAKK